MNIIKLLSSFTFLLIISKETFSQTINFSNLKKEDKHIASINAGLDYGLVYGASYGYQLKSKIPFLLNMEFSAPSGDNLFDDFKTKVGGQMRFYQIKNFNFSGKFHGIYRRNMNDFVTLQNFGTELSTTVGYYKSKWFTAGEVGFDKAIVTRFKHTSEYKQIYPAVKDGWYEPATGGNFNFGLLGGWSFKKSDIFLKSGVIFTQDFSKPLLPFYAQLGYTARFGQKK